MPVMPEFFFHVSLELVRSSKQDLGSTGRLPTPAQRTALSSFLHNPEHKVSVDSTIETTARASVRHHQANKRTLQETGTIAEQTIPSSPNDHRIDEIYIDGTDMSSKRPVLIPEDTSKPSSNLISKGIGTSTAGLQTKGRYVPLEQETTDGGWGIVHLYRDAEETPGLYVESSLKGADLWVDGVHKKHVGKPHPPPKDEDCTTLCILAVPSYLTPADFLAFVGEDTRNQVSHFRMIRTSRANRYMVLMKFRHGKKAREWQYEWNGKVFNSMEPETCHVVFLKSVEVIVSPSTDPANSATTYPKTPNDPFSSSAPSSTSTAVAAKPLPPPTPSLIELPTCPVCLERMDETTGLLTILCQHVFHCTCLQKWSGGGCPVCRYTHDDFSSRSNGKKHKSKKHFLKNGEYEVEDYEDAPLECETCQAESSLWQCLICGKVGCGRYEGKHAYTHFEETGHSFSMDLESKRVWDYSGDGYVHRILQDSGAGEKVVELPGRGVRGGEVLDGRDDEDEWGIKMENVGLEYTHLLTSQLESQRVYFEEVLERAVDKATEASRRAEAMETRFERMEAELQDLKKECAELKEETVPNLEKERGRAAKRSEKVEGLAREMERKWQSETAMVTNLMKRIKHLEESERCAKDGEKAARERVAVLEEENRDLLLNFTMGEKIQAMTADEGGIGEELAEGTVGVPEQHGKRRKGKGKK